LKTIEQRLPAFQLPDYAITQLEKQLPCPGVYFYAPTSSNMLRSATALPSRRIKHLPAWGAS
jgi:hypothetical protein